MTNIKSAVNIRYNPGHRRILQANSRQVSSNQDFLHPGLAVLVSKHLATSSRKPVADHNLAAFRLLTEELAARPRPLVLDSFCGTGHSTATLASRHPDHLVVGIDKSSQRLGKHPAQVSGNYLLIHAQCEDVWQLLVEVGAQIDYHYLLYPNPWPKAKHLQRRVHGSASFPLLLQLGGMIELRSNWQVYVEEFGVAMHLAGYPGHISRVLAQPAISLFERKYADSGHDLWAFSGRVRGATSATGR